MRLIKVLLFLKMFRTIFESERANGMIDNLFHRAFRVTKLIEKANAAMEEQQ